MLKRFLHIGERGPVEVRNAQLIPPPIREILHRRH